jgi:hypothetical protein
MNGYERERLRFCRDGIENKNGRDLYSALGSGHSRWQHGKDRMK